MKRILGLPEQVRSRAAVFWLRVLIIIKFKTLVSASITKLDCLVLTLDLERYT